MPWAARVSIPRGARDAADLEAQPREPSARLDTDAEWVQKGHPKTAEVSHVARDDGEPMDPGDGGDHGVLVERVGLAMHELSPAAKDRSIHGQNVEGDAHLIEPLFDLGRFRRILFAGELNAGLDFSKGDTGEMEIGIVHAVEPGEHSAMGFRPAQL